MLGLCLCLFIMFASEFNRYCIIPLCVILLIFVLYKYIEHRKVLHLPLHHLATHIERRKVAAQRRGCNRS